MDVPFYIGIGGDSAASMIWGLRDFRLVFKVCDDKCKKCSNQGCQTCINFLQRKDFKCEECILGLHRVNNVFCYACSNNCLKCKSENQCYQCS